MNIFKNIILGSDIGACTYVREKCIAWLPLAMTAASAVSSLIGGKKSADANAEAQRQLRLNRASDDAWYRAAKNVKYADTSSGRRTLDVARDTLAQQNKYYSGTLAVSGGTTAASAASKEKMNNAMANVAGSLSAVDTQRQMNADAAHRQDNRHYATTFSNLEMQRQQNIAQAAGGLSNSLMSGTALLDGNNTKDSVSKKEK